MDYLQEQKYSPSTINATLAAIRGTAQTAFNLYRMDGDDLARIRAIKMVRGSRLPTGRMIPLGEISSLVNTCIADEKASGPRDAAIIGLLYIAGLRRAEVVYLQRKDVDIKNQVLTVIGKGNKQRKAFLDIGTINALKDWLKYRTDIAGPLFVRVLKNGTLKF
ncbi:tyrosine-type recombinase/integrase, partial [Thiolapillus sp.]